jgi:hypothetical protein
MKKLLLFFILSCFIQTKAQTNVYHPFPDSNAMWCDTTCGSCSYTLAGDTLVNSNTYHKLHQSCVYYQWSASGICEYPSVAAGATAYVSIGYAGAIRQDTAQRKVYFLFPGSTKDTLLYDFTLSVGDTIRAYIMAGYVIDTIDSTLIGTQYRKTWTTSQGFRGGKLIEGIGGTLGLLNTYYQSWGPVSKLYCFSQNNQTLYPHYSATSVCAEVTAISTFKTHNPTFQIYPNPAQNNFTIELSNNDKQIISVYDVNGKQVLLQTINGTANIDASNFNAGVYNISIINSQGVTNKRLVIVR